jgi:hypothetical protein
LRDAPLADRIARQWLTAQHEQERMIIRPSCDGS